MYTRTLSLRKPLSCAISTRSDFCSKVGDVDRGSGVLRSPGEVGQIRTLLVHSGIVSDVLEESSSKYVPLIDHFMLRLSRRIDFQSLQGRLASGGISYSLPSALNYETETQLWTTRSALSRVKDSPPPRVTKDNTPALGSSLQGSIVPRGRECRSRTGCRWKDLAEQLSEHASLGVGIVLGAVTLSFENWSRGCAILCYLRNRRSVRGC